MNQPRHISDVTLEASDSGDKEKCYETGKTNLFYYIRNANIDENILRELINKGSDFRHRSYEGYTRLMSTETSRRFITGFNMVNDAGSKISAEGKNGKELLFYALEQKDCDTDTINYPLCKGPNVNHICNKDLCPLVYNRNSDIAVLLVDAESRHSDKCKNKETVLFFAVENSNCDRDTIIRIINKAFDIDHISDDGYTPLLYALSRFVDTNIINILIDAGCNINLLSREGLSALSYSTRNGYDTNLIIKLIDRGLDLNHRCKAGRTPLMYALIYNRDPKIAKILITTGANIKLRDNFDRNMLMLITSRTCCDGDDDCVYKEIIELFLSGGLNLHEIDNHGNTVLHYVHCKYLIKLAVRKGVSLNKKNHKGNTPLMVACINGDVKKAKTLLLCYANPNCLKNIVRSPSGFVVPRRYHKSEIINLLVYHGADLKAECFPGRKPPSNLLPDCDFYIIHAWSTAIIKNLLLFIDENKNIYHFSLEWSNSSSEDDSDDIDFIHRCKTELHKMRCTYIKDGLSFYYFCIFRKLYGTDFIYISYKEYKYDYKEIKDLFPIYNDLIIMRMKDDRHRICRKVLLNSLQNIIIKPQLINECDTSIALPYDCLVSIGHFLNNNQIYKLFLASIES